MSPKTETKDTASTETSAPPAAAPVPTPAPAPKTPPPKAPPPPNTPKPTTAVADRTFTPQVGKQAGRGQEVLLYGPGGIGKTALACLAPRPVIIDLDDGSLMYEVTRLPSEQVSTWEELRAAVQFLAKEDWLDTIVIDTATAAEELCIDWVVRNVPTDKGRTVTSIEGYGYGKGLQYVFDAFLTLLADCDAARAAGKNVILVAHEVVDEAPNPFGEDFRRYEPAMQSPKSGKNSVRNRVFQWADHVLFIGYDVVAEDRKGRGGGTRTIYTNELPSHRAKTRAAEVAPSLQYVQGDGTIWEAIGCK